MSNISADHDIAPLYAESERGPEPGLFFINLKEKNMHYVRWPYYNTVDRKECLTFPVTNLLSLQGMNEIRRRANLYLTDLYSGAYLCAGEEPALNSKGEKAREEIQRVCDTVCKNPAFLNQGVEAEQTLKQMPLEQLWPANTDADQAETALTARMASVGVRIVGDIRHAFYEKLEEADEQGKEFSPEQQGFLEEMRKKLSRSPLHQKPTPGQ
jgi:hypothetical protein